MKYSPRNNSRGRLTEWANNAFRKSQKPKSKRPRRPRRKSTITSHQYKLFT